MEDEETVTIPRKEYEDLVQSQKWLSALENAGVDNWNGISFAYELMEEDAWSDEEKPRSDGQRLENPQVPASGRGLEEETCPPQKET